MLMILLSLAFAQPSYKGLIYESGRIIDCGLYLNRYAHGGVPSPKEDTVIKTCCRVLRKVAREEGLNPLLEAHLLTCRRIGR